MPAADVIQPSASIASTGKGIRYIGNWAYALSGQFGSDTSAVTHLEFMTGSGYIIADLYCNGATSIGSPSNGRTTIFDLSFNGIVVANFKTDSAAADFSTMPAHNKIVIPPLTEVKLIAVSDSTSGDRLTSVVLTGRVYGAV